MASCEMCGKIVDKLSKIKIEGSTMGVCSNCERYGAKLTSPSNNHVKNFSFKKNEEIEEMVVSNFAQIIKNEREKRSWKQEDVAKKINEKESLIHAAESGNFNPKLITVKKFERLFEIKLIEKSNSKVEYKKEEKNTDGLTIGDLIKFK